MDHPENETMEVLVEVGGGAGHGVLIQRVRDKLDTPQWKSLRSVFLQASEVILRVTPDAQGDLAGTYVKFTTGPHPTSAAYAVVWLKASAPKRLIFGLALPEDFEAEGLGPSPERLFYKGLTKFFVIGRITVAGSNVLVYS